MLHSPRRSGKPNAGDTLPSGVTAGENAPRAVRSEAGYLTEIEHNFTREQCKHDFPGGAGRFVQRGRGYEQVIVNGQVFMEYGEHTGALAGRRLRS